MAGKSSISRITMKAMGIFGGVQMVGIICSIIRTKLVAMWLGPVGVGLFSLFNKALEMINTATNLGVRQSSVRDISQATEKNDTFHIARVITVVRRWSMWLGLGGALITMALAPLLSQWTFGDDAHMWGFVALASAVLLMALTNGELAVLQGLSKLKRLANATMWGTVFGLVVSIPLFYFLRQDSVVPSIIAYAAGCMLFAWLFRNRDYSKVKMGVGEVAKMGKGFIALGIFMTVGTFLTMLMDYVFNAWLNHAAGTSQVGFYQAGYTLVNKYTGLVLTALGMEYYPRLARVAKYKLRSTVFVSKEINIAMMAMAPIIALFMLLRSEIVWILYTDEFQKVILTFVCWALIGTVFRTLSWCMAFVILARGDGKIYIITEALSDIIGLGLNIYFYQLWGLNGLGISFMVWYVVYTLIIGVVYFKVYHLRLSPSALLDTLWALAIAAAMMFCVESGYLAASIVITVVTLIRFAFQAKKQWRG